MKRLWKVIKWTSFVVVAGFFGLAWIGSNVDFAELDKQLAAKHAEAATPKPVAAAARECPNASQAVLRLDQHVEHALQAQGLTFERPSIWLMSQARGAKLTNRDVCEYAAWSFVDVRNGFGGFTRSTITATLRTDGNLLNWQVGNVQIAQ